MTPVFDGLSKRGSESSTQVTPPVGATATPSVIGSGMELDGQLRARGDLRIEGRVKGSIKTEGEVVVARKGFVDGDIEAREVHVGGRVSGKITASAAARFMEGCQVDAEVRAPAIQIEEGGTVNGRLLMEKGRTAGGASGSASGSTSSSEKEKGGGASGSAGESGSSGGAPAGGGSAGGGSYRGSGKDK